MRSTTQWLGEVLHWKTTDVAVRYSNVLRSSVVYVYLCRVINGHRVYSMVSHHDVLSVHQNYALPEWLLQGCLSTRKFFAFISPTLINVHYIIDLLADDQLVKFVYGNGALLDMLLERNINLQILLDRVLTQRTSPINKFIMKTLPA